MTDRIEPASGPTRSAQFSTIVPLFNVDLVCKPGHAFVWQLQPGPQTADELIVDSGTITLLRWDPDDTRSTEAISRFCPPNSLPTNFDIYDAFPQNRAGVILVTQTIELYPPSPAQKLLLSVDNSLTEELVLRSFATALKLLDDTEPHVYKGFCFKDNHSTGSVVHWPIKEMQGPRMTLDTERLNKLKPLFFDLARIESTHTQSPGHRVILLAQRYYVLSSRQTEYDIIFLLLMIAFEALFRRDEKEDVSKARQRFCRLVAQKKSEYKCVSDFMSEHHNVKGCCYLRNGLVHGNINASSVDSKVFWQLKAFIRVAILGIVEAMRESRIDRDNYYDSLERYTQERFSGLPI